ncbi:MAG: Fic family protein, partial [Saprospiraceae bacterium]
MYTWQQPEWPIYRFDLEQHQAMLVSLYGQAQRLRGNLGALPKELRDAVKSEAYTDEGLANAAVEGEHYLRDHVRSSTLVALGLADASALKGSRKALAIGRLSIVAMQQANEPLSRKTIHRFHQLALGDDEDPRVGTWRKNKRPLYVISGAVGQEEIHFEAPPCERVPMEMETFIVWYNQATDQKEHPERAFLSSAIAHLYFETIHPYFDGNGRVGRAIAEAALCKQLGFALPFSISGAVLERKPAYYAALKTGSSSLDIN